MSLLNRRGAASSAALGMGVGVSAGIAIDLTALLVAGGLGPWAMVGLAGGGAIIGGLVIFFHNKLWGNLVLQKLTQIETQFITVATETAIVSGEMYHLRGELAAIRRGLQIAPPGTNPPPAPDRIERP